MGHLNQEDISDIMNALTSIANWRGIMRVFDASLEYPGLRESFSSRIYNDVFYASMKLSSRFASKHAFSTFERLVEREEDARYMKPKAFNFLYVSLCKSLLVDEAKIVHEKCVSNGYYLNRYSYNTFLNACAKTNRVEDAFLSLKAMAESNILPDVVSCNVLISCCVRSDEIDVALSVLHRMPLWGIPRDIYSYNSVINGFRKAKMLEEAFDLVASMEIASGLDPIEGRTPPDDLGIVAAVTSTDGFTESHEITDDDNSESNGTKEMGYRVNGNNKYRMQSNGEDPSSRSPTSTPSRTSRPSSSGSSTGSVRPDLVTYNTLISGIAACDCPNLDRARAVEAHMRSQGIDGNEVTYNALMAAATRAGKVDEAFAIYDDMMERQLGTLNVELFTTLITLCGQAGQLERAFKVHEQMVSNGINPSVVTFNALLTACRRGGGNNINNNASDIALQVMQIMRDTPGCTPDVITYSTLIDTLGRAGRFREMRELLQDMKLQGLTPNFVTYTCMISAMAKSGDLDAAMRLIDDMESKGIEPNVYTFSCLVGGAKRKKELSRGMDILDMMKQRGIVPNNVTYSLLLQMTVRSGQQKWIDRLMKEMSGDKRLMRNGYFDTIGRLLVSEEATNEKLERIFDIIDEALNERRLRGPCQ